MSTFINKIFVTEMTYLVPMHWNVFQWIIVRIIECKVRPDKY